MKLLKILVLIFIILILAGCSAVTNTMATESNKAFNTKSFPINTEKEKTYEATESNQTKEQPVKGYIFNFSGKQLLNDENVKYLNSNLRALARNEIYARHGFIFRDPYFKNYFESCGWYTPNTNFKGNYSDFSEVERKNIELIKSFENENGDEYGNNSFNYQDQKTYKANAKFDLNGDGQTDDVEYIKNSEGKDTFSLRVNNSILKAYGSNLSEKFTITNFSGRRGFYDIVIYEDGPSDDPMFSFYYYNGKDIIKMGTCDGYQLKPDGHGKLYSTYSYIPGVEMISGQTIPISWYEISNDHKLEIKYQDKNKLIGQKIKVLHGDVIDNNDDYGIKLFPKHDSNPYGDDFITTVNKGDILTILDIGDLSRESSIKVETQDGKIGWRVHMFGGD
ncbi:MAG: YARHG domain-containing protein [Bacillota bacterium]|nr:YARHG domain-containing protein [Bacillota bacterium]